MLLKILVQINYIGHLLACGWVVIGRRSDQDGKPNWLANAGREGPLRGREVGTS